MGLKYSERKDEAQKPQSGAMSEEQREKILKDLIEVGADVIADAQPFCLPQEIPWFDKEKYEAGRRFAWRYFASCIISSAWNALLTPMIMPLANSIYTNGNFNPRKTTFHLRALDSVRHQFSWFFTDLTDPKSAGVRSLRYVRLIHKAKANKLASPNQLPFRDIDIPKKYHDLAEIIRTDFVHTQSTGFPENLNVWRRENGGIHFSQLHMMAAIFAFSHMLLLHPEDVGIPSKVNEKEVEGYLHLWAIIGRMAGIQDRFNILLHTDRKLFQKLIRPYITACLKNIDATATMFLYTTLENATRTFLLGIPTPNTFLLERFRLMGEDAECRGFKAQTTLRDSFLLPPFHVIMKLYRKSGIFRTILNWFSYFAGKLVFRIFLPKRGSRVHGKGNSNGICSMGAEVPDKRRKA